MTGLPDAEYIRKHIPILDVAYKLDLEVHPNNMIRCWHPENHHHADRTPSVGIEVRRNFVKCFGCDSKKMGPIDLVIDVQDLHRLPEKKSILEAISWIDKRFDVPPIPKHKPVEGGAAYMCGTEDPIELLVQSRIFATLPGAAQRLAAVLSVLPTTNSSGEIRIRGSQWDVTASYFTLKEFIGSSSDETISRAFKELEQIGWCRREPSQPAHATGPVKKSTIIHMTPFSDDFLELANATAAARRQASEAQKAIRQDRRRERQREHKRRSRSGQKNAAAKSQL